jgi:cystathionine beta-lyase
MTDKPDRQPLRPKTRLVNTARPRMPGPSSPVNPPVVRASTVLYADTDAAIEVVRRRKAGERILTYGARGTPTTFLLEEALNEIEQGERTQLLPTGLAAVAHVLLTLTKPGDHILLADTIYGPSRQITKGYLVPRGVDCEFYPGGAGGADEVKRRLRPETKLVFLDNPGSIVFDVQDLPAIAAAVKGSSAVVAVDNTWGAPGLYTPLALGADVSIVALTKYIGGHSDFMMGSVTAKGEVARRLWQAAELLGMTVSSDDAWMMLRGLRTASGRIAQQTAHAAEVIAWLQQRPEVERLLYPSLPTDPGYALWKRDFKGTNSLFSIVLQPQFGDADTDRMLNAFELIGIGASWGGYESLVLNYPGGVHGWRGGTTVRFHIGLEDPADIIADLERGFAAMNGG